MSPTADRAGSAFALAFALLVSASCGAKHGIRPADAGRGDADGSAPDLAAPDAPDGTDAPTDGRVAIDTFVDRFVDGSVDTSADAFVAALVPFCKDKAVRVCDALVRCENVYLPLGDCRLQQEAICTSELDTWQVQAASKGRLTFDANRAASCLAAIEAATCDQLSVGELPACRGVASSQLPFRAPCIFDGECASGFCPVRADRCGGTCSSYGGVGSPCSDEPVAQCDLAVSWCDRTSSTCRAFEPTGAACTDGDRCGRAAYCRSPRGARCGGFNDKTDCHCAPRGAVGNACQASEQCLDGLACWKGVCIGRGTRGAVCDLGVGCAEGLVCLQSITAPDPTTGTCGDALPDGAPCRGSDCGPASDCFPVSDVESDPGVCRKKLKVGDTCLDFGPGCPAASTCSDAHRCVAYPRRGEPCGGSNPPPCFGIDLYCDSKTELCTVMPALGQPCNDQCVTGAYCSATHVCMPRKAGGETCTDSFQCASDSCDEVYPDPATNECPGGSCTNRCRILCSYANADGGV